MPRTNVSLLKFIIHIGLNKVLKKVLAITSIIIVASFFSVILPIRILRFRELKHLARDRPACQGPPS